MRYVEVEWFIRPDGTRQASPWPDYPRSLDAMHEELATVKDQDQRKRWMDRSARRRERRLRIFPIGKGKCTALFSPVLPVLINYLKSSGFRGGLHPRSPRRSKTVLAAIARPAIEHFKTT